MPKKFIQQMTVEILPNGGFVTVRGREAWALRMLLDAGERGCTPINRPAPRWSAYILLLRQKGFDIETIYEHHDGPYAGTHGRYVLRSKIRVVREDGGIAA